jgi:hypothetical protein
MPSRAKEDRQRSGLAPATKGKDVLLLLLSHLRARILRGKRRPAHPQRRQIERSASESMPTPGNTSISRLPTLRFEREEIASIEAFPSLRDRLHRLSSLGFCSENGVCSSGREKEPKRLGMGVLRDGLLDRFRRARRGKPNDFNETARPEGAVG